MTPVLLNSQIPNGPYISGAPAGGSLDLVKAASDASLGNSFKLTGHEVLLAENTDSGAQTITITSSPDAKGRSQDITAYSIAAGKTMAYSFLSGQEGWIEGDGTCHVMTSSALVKLTVLYVQR